MKQHELKLYNTSSRRIEPLQPLQPPRVSVYTCGPTVYDYSHVGHWFNYVRMDTLLRTLTAAGFQPTWIMNITDVGHLVSDADAGEDKLEKGARREGKTAWEVAEFYTNDFIEGMRKLNIRQPEELPRATSHIDEQVALIQRLEAKGYTYKIDDGIYFDTSRFPTYEQFAHLNLEQQRTSDRIDENLQKLHPSDFALWKFSAADKKRDMEWDSPWGKGFPGWHIECSAMSMHYLGETIDIHTGGIDHIPVHHTNEIAQSEAATGQPFVRHWMHSNHILVDGEKISKSLGNGIHLQEIEDKGIDPLALRLYVLQSHYRKQAIFGWSGLEAAQKQLQDFRAIADLRWQTLPASDAPKTDTRECAASLLSKLANDLNTPQALAKLNTCFNSLSESLVTTEQRQDFEDLLRLIDDLLGLDLLASTDITQEQKQLLQQRAAARQQQDWNAADQLRDSLSAQGIGVRDTQQGQVWQRI